MKAFVAFRLGVAVASLLETFESYDEADAGSSFSRGLQSGVSFQLAFKPLAGWKPTPLNVPTVLRAIMSDKAFVGVNALCDLRH